MNWHTLTVRQAQDVERVRRAAKDEDGLDSETKLLAAITGKKQSEIDSLPWVEYVKLRRQLDFMENPIEGGAAKFIKVNGRRYRCIYDISKMPFARYIEGKQFNQDFMMNMHKIAASMVMPQKKTWYGWKDKEYNALDHAEYAKDMLDAPFLTVYNSCVFFLSCISELDGGFKGLFDKRSGEEDESGRSRQIGERFTNLYGWQYTTKTIADHYNISVTEAYELPTIEAVNTMAYLKAKTAFDKEVQRGG